mgnify:CR=1 FL=1
MSSSIRRLSKRLHPTEAISEGLGAPARPTVWGRVRRLVTAHSGFALTTFSVLAGIGLWVFASRMLDSPLFPAPAAIAPCTAPPCEPRRIDEVARRPNGSCREVTHAHDFFALTAIPKAGLRVTDAERSRKFLAKEVLRSAERETEAERTARPAPGSCYCVGP